MSPPPGRSRRGGGGVVAARYGAVAVEYALIASLTAILAIGGLQAFGVSLGGLYGSLRRIVAALLGGS